MSKEDPKKKKSMTERVHMLPTAEVVAYTGTPRQIRRKKRRDERDERRSNQSGSNSGKFKDRIKKWRNRKKQ